MNGPKIYVVIKGHGDGYGHNSYDYVAWYFDKNEARKHAEQKRGDFEWFDVEEVPAGSPMEESQW